MPEVARGVPASPYLSRFSQNSYSSEKNSSIGTLSDKAFLGVLHHKFFRDKSRQTVKDTVKSRNPFECTSACNQLAPEREPRLLQGLTGDTAIFLHSSSLNRTLLKRWHLPLSMLDEADFMSQLDSVTAGSPTITVFQLFILHEKRKLVLPFDNEKRSTNRTGQLRSLPRKLEFFCQFLRHCHTFRKFKTYGTFSHVIDGI